MFPTICLFQHPRKLAPYCYSVFREISSGRNALVQKALLSTREALGSIQVAVKNNQ